MFFYTFVLSPGRSSDIAIQVYLLRVDKQDDAFVLYKKIFLVKIFEYKVIHKTSLLFYLLREP